MPHRVEELFLRGSRRLALFEGSFHSLFVHAQDFADDLWWQRLPCHCARSSVVPTRAHAYTHTRRTHMPTSEHTGARGHATIGQRPSCQDARRKAIFSRAERPSFQELCWHEGVGKESMLKNDTRVRVDDTSAYSLSLKRRPMDSMLPLLMS
jgi:hypothetical protein